MILCNHQPNLDLLLALLMKHCLNFLVSIVTRTGNRSLCAEPFPSVQTDVVKLLFKKPGLDHNEFQNVRHVLNFPFLSKMLERVVLTTITCLKTIFVKFINFTTVKTTVQRRMNCLFSMDCLRRLMSDWCLWWRSLM